ncbi:MAG: protein kinase [Acidobacteria bacterium]|nr:protein kinase [Acidobacteriota bacterium]
MVIGSTISHYKIVEKLGEGGMGVVYKAEDTTLERTVALKFLADHLLNDEEAKERCLREAKAAAALDHPNICTVHEIGEVDGKTFLAMAFLKGETLEDRITQGPLSLKDALDVARQVADGLEAAHEAAIVHRDIKPANIMVDSKGRATIMDFGLARLTEASRLTKVDTAMGTVAYMSPEQAQGMEVDHRSDLWSLGCVLHEMVSGQRPFKGEYDQALLYEICHEEPAALTGLRTGVPIELELLASKCLAKDRDDRYQYAKEIAVDLRTLAEKLKSGRSTILRPAPMTAAVTAMAGQTLNPVVAPPHRSSSRIWQALAGVLGVALLAVSLAYFSTPAPDGEPQALRRFSFSHEGVGAASISPDGRNVVFTVPREDGSSSLWLRAMGSETARELPGTAVRANRAGSWVPGWSPDSRSIVFGTNDQLKRIDLDGGDPVVLCSLSRPVGRRRGLAFLGASFSPDGDRIVYSSWLQLWEVSALGGEPKLLFQPAPGVDYWSPHFLPTGDGSQRLVFSVEDQGSNIWRTEALDLQTGEPHEVGPLSDAVYAPSGYLIHGLSEPWGVGLSATPFSIETLATVGETFPLETSGIAASVSRDGTLVYTSSASSAGAQIVVRDRSGDVLRSVGDPILQGQGPDVAPNGSRVVVSVDGDIWVYDLERDIGTRLTFTQAENLHPTWMPSSLEVSYQSADGVVVHVADGSQAAKAALTRANGVGSGPVSWSADGRYVAYAAADPAGGEGGIWYREIGSGGSLSEPISYLRTPFSEDQPQISPDRRYLAYRSNESGRPEVYVRPFPEGSGKWQVSTNGGVDPRWAVDGRELFYSEGTTLMAVDVSTSGTFTVERPQRLFESNSLQQGGPTHRYDVFPDGQRFLMIDRDTDAAQDTIRIVENWDEPFRDREQ